MGLSHIYISFFRLSTPHVFYFAHFPFFVSFFWLKPSTRDLQFKGGRREIPFLSYKTIALLWWAWMTSFSSVKKKNKLKLTFLLAEYRPQRDWQLSLRHHRDTSTSRDIECLAQHSRPNYRVFNSLACLGRDDPQNRFVQTNKASAS